MRRLMTLGFLSMATALSTACSDDESSGSNGGSAGSNGGSSGANNGGSSGANNGGSSGANNGGSSGSSGAMNGGSGGGDNGGSGGSGSDPDAGDGGGGPPCTGCVELRVPVTAINQTTIFQFALGAPVDLSGAVITYRMRALTIDNQLAASPFAQDSDYNGFEQRFVNLDTGNGFTSPDEWVDIEHDLSAVAPADIIITDIPDGGDAGDGGGGTPTADPADFDKSRVIQFGLNVGSAGAFAAFPATVTVLLDSVTFTGVDATARPDITFDDSAEGFAVNSFNPQPGSEVIHHPAP